MCFFIFLLILIYLLFIYTEHFFELISFYSIQFVNVLSANTAPTQQISHNLLFRFDYHCAETYLTLREKFQEFVLMQLFWFFIYFLVVIQFYLSLESVIFFLEVALRGKCPNTEFFLVRIFSHSNWIRIGMEYLSAFRTNARKYGPEKVWTWTLFT